MTMLLFISHLLTYSMANPTKSPAIRTYYVWADHTDRVYQEIEAEGPKQAYQIAEQQPDCWQSCFEQDNNDYRLSNEVGDVQTGEVFTVGEVERCKTCGSEIVETVNGSNFHDGECGPCEYLRYKLQPALYSALNALFYAKALHDSEVPKELWEKVLKALRETERLVPESNDEQAS